MIVARYVVWQSLTSWGSSPYLCLLKWLAFWWEHELHFTILFKDALGGASIWGKKCLDFSQNGSVMLSGEIPFLLQGSNNSVGIRNYFEKNQQSQGSIPNSLTEPGRMPGELWIEKPCDVSFTKKKKKMWAWTGEPGKMWLTDKGGSWRRITNTIVTRTALVKANLQSRWQFH